VLVAQVWFFLPDHDHDALVENPMNNLFRGSSAAPNDNEEPYDNGESYDNGEPFNNGEPFVQKRLVPFKKRVRNQHEDASAALIHQVLSYTKASNGMMRFDAVPIILDQQSQSYGVVHQLPSIPDRRRMISSTNDGNDNNGGDHLLYMTPSDAVRNLTYFLESRTRPNEEDRPLFTYNPMLLPLDRTVIGESILNDLSLDTDPEDIAYLAVYRVSNFGNCHGPGKGVPETFKNYLGLALLDKNLNIIQDSHDDGTYLDVVIDLNQHLFDVWYTPFRFERHKKIKQYMQDCQLFAFKNDEDFANGKANQLMLLCNEYAIPVKLERTRTMGEEENEEEIIHFKNRYGTGLQLTALTRPQVILMKAKNMHYFEISHGGENPVGFLEIRPGGPHQVIPVDFTTQPYTYPYGKHREKLSTINSTKPEPDPSYSTHERETLIDRDSGSACCVSVQWEGRQFLLGISHRKTRKGKAQKVSGYSYLSRVYAFEPLPPFNIVARSGFFCLGFARRSSEEALQSDNEQILGAANDEILNIRNKVFDCPRIHFVSGIVEKLGDKETVIISYGVNDCYPRMIEVSKNFLVGLLGIDNK